MLRLRLALVSLVLLAPLLGGLAHGADTPGRYLVGYAPGNEQEAHLAIKAAGGDVQRSSPELGFAVVLTGNPAEFERLARLAPAIQYVETDDTLRLSGAQWNGAQWNGAQWNGAQWNGAQWNGAQWNGAQWNGAQWNDAELKRVGEVQRQAAKWTEAQFQADGTNKMKWAGDSTDPGLVWQWGAWATDANHAWAAGKTGTRSASLCVLDSGVAWDHPDVAPNYAAGYNAIDPAAGAYDDGGHGTHVAGIAAAALANGYGTAGVGNVQILNAKVLGSDGTGHESDLAFGLVWCALQDAEVALMALGVTETQRPTLQRALQYSVDRDVLLVASAGNGGCAGCVNYPASDPRVVAVSAVDGTLARASFSSQGPQVELAAPGVAMLGPLPADVYGFGSGTSQAAAYAAGVAALVRDAAPGLTASQARAALAASARDLGPAGRDASFGHGLVDVDGALARVA
jgi:subtilisin family serine protease